MEEQLLSQQPTCPKRVLPSDASDLTLKQYFNLSDHTEQNAEVDTSWRRNITVVCLNGAYELSVYNEGEFIRTFRIAGNLMYLFAADPMDPEAFGEHSPKTARELAALEEVMMGTTGYSLSQIARKEAIEYPMLTPDSETVLLIRMAAGDDAAKERLILSNMRLIWPIAIKAFQRSRGKVPFEDVVQEGYLGLLNSLNEFDFTRRGRNTPMGRISTYATSRIRKRTSRCIAEQSENIRIPVQSQEFIRKVWKIKKRLEQLGNAATPESIAKELLFYEEPIFIKTEVVSSAFKRKYERLIAKVNIALAARPEISLGTPLGDDQDSDTIEYLVRTEDPSPHEVLEHTLLRKQLLQIIKDLELSERDKDIILKRFGLFDRKVHTLKELGEIHGVSRQRMQQIEKEILGRMRHPRYRRKLPRPS